MFLMNDLSFHGQFRQLPEFYAAVDRLMGIRQAIHREKASLYCHRDLLSAQVTPSMGMRQAVHRMPMSKRRVLMSWISREGPHWENHREHSSDDYLTVGDDVVTDSAVGEVAACCMRSIVRRLISVEPSNWTYSPIPVCTENAERVDVNNYWTLEGVQNALAQARPPVRTWGELEKRIRLDCPNLSISDDAFSCLIAHPFHPSAALRFTVLFDVLQRFKNCFDANGSRSEEGKRLYQEHFTGGRAWFTDSSESEKKSRKASRFNFRHPEQPGEHLFCPWHGKVSTKAYRIHFSWPVTTATPLYVVYVGPHL